MMGGIERVLPRDVEMLRGFALGATTSTDSVGTSF